MTPTPDASPFDAPPKPAAPHRASDDPHAGPVSPDPGLKPGPLRAAVLALATGFGTGYSPFASGTTGTLPALILFWFLAPPFGSWISYSIATIFVILAAVPIATAAEGIFGKKDDGRVVIDEVAGFLVTMMWAPHSWKALVAGFFLFRLFDVLKLPPARRLQALPGGWGIVIDDVFAGIYACLCLHIIRWLWLLAQLLLSPAAGA